MSPEYYYRHQLDDIMLESVISIGISVVLLGMIIFCIVKFILDLKRRKNPAFARYRNKIMTTTVEKSQSASIRLKLHSVEEYKRTFPDFDAVQFVEIAKKYFSELIKMINGAEVDPEKVRFCFSDGYYRQLCSLRDNYRLNHVDMQLDDLEIFSVVPLGWNDEKGSDTMYVRFKYVCARYYVDTVTNKIVSGNKTNKLRIETELAFQHSDETASGVKELLCPNCGGVVKVGKTGVCEYCGTVLNADTYDWVLAGDSEISTTMLEREKE